MATTEWSFVDLGWLREETVACLVIENLEERDKGPNRVLDSIKDHRSKSLLVSYEANSSDCFFVFPAMFQPLFPSDPKRLMLRAAEGEVTYRIHAFPA